MCDEIKFLHDPCTFNFYLYRNIFCKIFRFFTFVFLFWLQCITLNIELQWVLLLLGRWKATNIKLHMGFAVVQIFTFFASSKSNLRRRLKTVQPKNDDDDDDKNKNENEKQNQFKENANENPCCTSDWYFECVFCAHCAHWNFRFQ